MAVVTLAARRPLGLAVLAMAAWQQVVFAGAPEAAGTAAPAAVEALEPRKGNSTLGTRGLRGGVAVAAVSAAGSAQQGKNASAKPAVAVACSAADGDAMERLGAGNAQGTFPEVVADCGRGSWSLFSGFDEGRYKRCLLQNVGFSGACAQCFVPVGEYAYRNCKFSCIYGSWCSWTCLECVRPAQPGVHQCVGVPIPQATAC